MAEKYKNKYRISSSRLQNWDYGANAMYFVTICTQNRQHYFGEIINNEMQLSELGMAAKKYWAEIPNHFPFVVLDAFVVMPNHVHGIIIINKNDDDRNIAVVVETQDFVETQNLASLRSTSKSKQTQNLVETQNLASLRQRQPSPQNKFGPQSKNLASIIRGFKIGVTKYAKNNDLEFGWQSRFHDHIIRNDKSYQNIVSYIVTNPQHWDTDENRK